MYMAIPRPATTNRAIGGGVDSGPNMFLACMAEVMDRSMDQDTTHFKII